jgi:hypothetical protein
MTGQALKMRCELANLAAHHGVTPVTPHIEDFLAECDGPHRLSGYASTADVDLERCRFLPFSLRWSAMPVLRRGTTARLSAQSTAWTDGRLATTVTTDHDMALRCGAFSVAATIHDYTIRDAEDPRRYRAEVRSASLTEIVLTCRPCKPHALVMHRVPQCPVVEDYNQIAARLQHIITSIGAMSHV